MMERDRVPSDRVSIGSGEQPQWHLQRAVMIYGTQGGSQEDRMYATLHKVEAGPKGPRLSSGVPATREACADLARGLGANASLGGFIPPNLLYLGAKSIIWWRPPGAARVFFDTSKDAAGDQPNDKSGAAQIGKTSGKVFHPGLVFAVAGGRWFVYALEDDKRPHALSPLSRAPYFNVWGSGEICTGNVRLPETLNAQSLAVYEKAFFESEFTHPNVHGKEKLTHHSSGPYGFWAGMLKRPLELGFPTQILVAMKFNLQTLAKRLEKSGKPLYDDD